MNTAAAGLEFRWRPAPIDRLVRLLAKSGFNVGASEAIDAAQLLKTLAEGEPARASLADLKALASRLGPVLCKSREEQEAFPALFDAWAELGQTVRPPPPPPADPPPPAGAGHGVGAGTAGSGWLAWWHRRRVDLLAWLFVATVGAALGWQAWRNQQSGSAPQAPAQAASAPAAPASGPVGQEPPLPSAPLAAPQELDGYYPQLRANRELRPEVGWVLLAASLALLALWLLPAAQPLLGRTRRSGHAVMLDASALRDEARRVVPPIGQATDERLGRHVAGPAVWRDRLQRRPPIDVPRTVEATLRQLGVLRLRYATARLNPSYLLLVDSASEADPRGRLFYRWAERLHTTGIEVQIRLFKLDEKGRAVTCVPAGAGWRLDGRDGEPLDRLGTPPIGQRLVIVSDGASLLTVGGSAWRDWARQARLQRWQERVLFTPTEPRHWGPSEDLLATGRAALAVLPLDESAFDAWSVLLATGMLPRFALSRPQRYPQLLRELDDAVLLDDDHPLRELPELLAQLKLYLGANGYYWLAACAVSPILRWDLTFLIGKHYLHELGVRDEDLRDFIAHSYARLALLPWLRHDHMPNWLRLALLDSLSPAAQDEVREVTRTLFGKLKEAAAGATALPLERPPGAIGDAPPQEGPGGGDMLYLGYLTGHTPRQLMLRAPKEWGGHFDLTPRAGLWRDRLGAWRDRLLFRNGLALLGASPELRWWALGGTVALLFAGLIEARLGADPEAPRWLAALHVERSYALASVHGGAVRDVSFSPDGRLALSAAEDGTARLMDTAAGRQVGATMPHAIAVKRAVFSPDGARVLTFSGAAARLWDLAGRPLFENGLPEGSGSFSNANEVDPFSADGRLFINAGPRGVSLLDARTGAEQGTLDREVLIYPVNAVGFSPDTRRIVTVGGDGEALQWDTATSKPIGEPLIRPAAGATGKPGSPPAGHVGLRSARYSPDGQRILTTDRAGDAQLWDTATGKPLGPAMHHDAPVASARFNPDGTLIATASGRIVRLWDGRTGASFGGVSGRAGEGLMAHDAAVRSVRFSADGRQLLSASDDGSARLWDAATGAAIGAPLRSPGRVAAAAFSPDSSRVLTAGEDGSARLWQARAALQSPVTVGGDRAVIAAALSPDGLRVASVGDVGRVQLWNTPSGKALGAPLPHPGVTRVAFSPDGRRLVSADNRQLRVWDLRNGTMMTLAEVTGVVSEVVFSPDGQRLASADLDGSARLWDAVTGKALGRPMRHEISVLSVEFSPDGEQLVTTTGGGPVTIWNAHTGEPSGRTVPTTGTTRSATFSGDGRRILTVDIDKGAAQIWGLRGSWLLDAEILQAELTEARFRPDGERVLTAGRDGVIRLWDGRTGEPLGAPNRVAGPVTAAAFSADGRHVLTAWAETAERARPGGVSKADNANAASAAQQYGKGGTPVAVANASAANQTSAPALRGGVVIWDVPTPESAAPAALDSLPQARWIWAVLALLLVAAALAHSVLLARRRRQRWSAA